MLRTPLCDLVAIELPIVQAPMGAWASTSSLPRSRGPARPEQVRAELDEAKAVGRSEELLPFTGQSAGLIHDLLPAAEIVAQLAADAERALAAAGALVATG